MDDASIVEVLLYTMDMCDACCMDDEEDRQRFIQVFIARLALQKGADQDKLLQQLPAWDQGDDIDGHGNS